MKCYECEGECIKKSGSLEMTDDCIGAYVVQDVEYYKCDSCKGFMFPVETSRVLDEKREEKKIELIRNLPLNDFITAAESYGILGISRQAFHKHRRIRKGFIYRASIGGITLYSRRSVLLFQSSGDGRFTLNVSLDRKIYLEPDYGVDVPELFENESMCEPEHIERPNILKFTCVSNMTPQRSVRYAD